MLPDGGSQVGAWHGLGKDFLMPLVGLGTKKKTFNILLLVPLHVLQGCYQNTQVNGDHDVMTIVIYDVIINSPGMMGRL